MYQGQDFTTEIEFLDGESGLPIDMSGRSARMQARTSIEDPLAMLSLSTDDGTIALAAGVLRFQVPAMVTSLLGRHDVEQWVFDIELVTPGPTPSVRRIL